jgi:DNA-binding response OmpR family regulator
MTASDDDSILIVDDDPNDATLIVRGLRKSFDGPIQVVHDADDAVDRLLGPHGNLQSLPRLVVLDLHLPGISGFEVLRRLRAGRETRLLPVLILTTSDDARDVARSYALGANGYVCKPVAPVEFDAAMRRVAEYWVELNEVASLPFEDDWLAASTPAPAPDPVKH